MKKLLSLVLVAAMAIGMTACSSGGTSSTATESKPAEDKPAAESTAEAEPGKLVEINLPTYKAGENVGAVFFLPHIERFNKKFEGKYKINIEEVPQASYSEKIKQLAQQKKLPPLIHAGVDNEWFKSVAIPNGYAYDLTEWYQSSPSKDFFIQDSVDYSTRDGKLITVPQAVTRPIGLYYNSAIYTPDKAIHEMTLDEFISSIGENKIAMQTADNGWCSALILSAILANEEGGQDILKNNVDDKLADYTAAPIVAAVEKLQKIMQTNAASNSIGAAYADAANNFMSGGSAVICNGPWMAADFAADSTDKWSNDFDGKNARADLYFGNVGLANTRGFGDWWVSGTATEDELALVKEYLNFAYSQEELEAYMLAEGGSCPGMTYTENFLTKQKETQVLADLSNAVNDKTVFVPSMGDIMPTSVAETEFGKMLPKLADGSMTAQQFCEELTKKAKDALQS